MYINMDVVFTIVAVDSAPNCAYIAFWLPWQWGKVLNLYSTNSQIGILLQCKTLTGHQTFLFSMITEVPSIQIAENVF